MNAEPKLPSRNRRVVPRGRSLDEPGRKVIEQLVNVLRRFGYASAAIVEAVQSASQAALAGTPQASPPDVPEFREAPHVMAVWHTDPAYTDARGRPLALKLRGPAPSFESLVQRVNRTRRSIEMLRYLLRAGAVEKSGRRYLARTRWVSLRGMPQATSARSLRTLRGMLSNCEQNSLPREQAESWFEYAAENDHFPRSRMRELAEFYQRDCMASLRRVDAFMLRCEHEREPGEPTMHVGFGMYRFHEADADRDAQNAGSLSVRRRRRGWRGMRVTKGGSRDRQA